MNRAPFILNFIFFLVCLFLNLVIDWNPPKWVEYSDPEDYIAQSKMSLLDKEFYSPHQKGVFFPRPFTVPLFYKMGGSNPVLIVQMQKYIHSLSTFFLVYALLLIFNRQILQYLAIFFIYFLMSWWNILGWSIQILSESLSISLFFCWLASFLILWKKRGWFFLLVHMIITILFSFTRDTWPYMIVAFYLFSAVYFYFIEKILFRKLLFLLGFSLILFMVQQQTVLTGTRYRLAMINTITVRILSNPAYTAWFVAHGMPCTDSLVNQYNHIDVNVDADRHKIWDVYYNPKYRELSQWISTKGRGVYFRFMMTHPAYFLLFTESKDQRRRILSSNLWYTGDVRGYSRLSEYIFPVFRPISILLGCLSLIVIFFRKRGPFLFFPVLLSLVLLLNVFLSYNADALEVERHLFITMIVIQFIGFLSVTMILDVLLPDPVMDHS